MRQSDIEDATNRPIVRALLILEQAINALEIAIELDSTTLIFDAVSFESTLREFSEKNADAGYFLRNDVKLDDVLCTLYAVSGCGEDIFLPSVELVLCEYSRYRSFTLVDAKRVFDAYLRRGASSNIILEWFVEHGANIRDHDDYAMRWAAGNGLLDVVEYLVERGANICAGQDEAVRWAAESGHFKMVKWLAERGANIHANDDEPLQGAAARGHLDVVKWLVEQGADINTNRVYAIRMAAENGHLDVVKWITERGVDGSVFDDRNLQNAAKNGHFDMVKWLVENMPRNRYNYMLAATQAAENNHIDIFKYLANLYR